LSAEGGKRSIAPVAAATGSHHSGLQSPAGRRLSVASLKWSPRADVTAPSR